MGQFKVKKRPNALQSFMKGLSAGASKSAPKIMEMMMKKSDAEKEQKKTFVSNFDKIISSIQNPETKAEAIRLKYQYLAGEIGLGEMLAYTQGLDASAFTTPDKTKVENPPITIAERSRKKNEDDVIRNSSDLGLTVDDYINRFPENPDAILYKKYNSKVQLRPNEPKSTESNVGYFTPTTEEEATVSSTFVPTPSEFNPTTQETLRNPNLDPLNIFDD